MKEQNFKSLFKLYGFFKEHFKSGKLNRILLFLLVFVFLSEIWVTIPNNNNFEKKVGYTSPQFAGNDWYDTENLPIPDKLLFYNQGFSLTCLRSNLLISEFPYYLKYLKL